MTTTKNNDLLNDLLDHPFDQLTPSLNESANQSGLDFYDQLPEERQKQAQALASKIDEKHADSIVSYGSQAQKQLSEFSHQMINDVKSKDLGDIGSTLRELMTKLETTDPKELSTPQTKNPLIRWFKKQKASFYELNAKYQQVGYQIDAISESLSKQKNQLLADNHQLEDLYQQNFQYFEALNVFIAAAQLKLKKLQQEDLPKRYEQAQETQNQMTIQEVNDLKQFINRLEKRIYDLQLSRQVTIQQAPQIRMIQNTNQNLAEKIQSSINTAIPLWKNQIAIQLSLHRQQDALEAQTAVTNTTNDLLRKNADMLEQSTLEAARQNERGVVDIETLEHTQEKLMHTIEETLAIQQEGRLKRAEAEKTMLQMENDLKHKLLKPDDNSTNHSPNSMK
ncbi:MAG: toxic anion resistance protein [Aerococcus suis]|nr:toxic anion resistance protein [Aerococcus suis]